MNVLKQMKLIWTYELEEDILDEKFWVVQFFVAEKSNIDFFLINLGLCELMGNDLFSRCFLCI